MQNEKSNIKAWKYRIIFGIKAHLNYVRLSSLDCVYYVIRGDCVEKAEIRVDKELLKQVEPILKEIGLTVEKAVELFFKEIIRIEKIPFPLDEKQPRTFKELVAGFEGEYQSDEWDTGEPVGNEDIYSNKEYMERLLKSKKQIEEGKGHIRELIEE